MAVAALGALANQYQAFAVKNELAKAHRKLARALLPAAWISHYPHMERL
jgi:hypothetical protein